MFLQAPGEPAAPTDVQPRSRRVVRSRERERWESGTGQPGTPHHLISFSSWPPLQSSFHLAIQWVGALSVSLRAVVGTCRRWVPRYRRRLVRRAE